MELSKKEDLFFVRNKTRFDSPQANRAVFCDVHEPMIDCRQGSYFNL